jgi:SAM-dependent methyltransferase
MAQQMKGWFHLPGRPGDRSFEEQLKGLDWLLANCNGKTVLDAGCAEGLIAIELAKRGAVAVHGIEMIEDRVVLANKLRGDLPVTFEVGDMNVWRPRRQYDIVIGLAILHKLKDPGAVAVALANAARETVVFRLPPFGAPTVLDKRSGFVPHDIGALMSACGFALSNAACDGHLGEYVGRWGRV